MALNRLLTSPRRRKEPVTLSDPQRESVYDMERCFIGHTVHHTADRGHLFELARHACEHYGIDMPRIKIVNLKRRIFGWHDENVITLNRGYHGANASTLLHELAHHIVDALKPSCVPHGPEFCAVYRYLLDKYRMLPKRAFDALARAHGVKIGRQPSRRR